MEEKETCRNPWMIYKIVENTLTHLSFHELRDVRLVNSIWDDAASRLMQDRCKDICFGRFPHFEIEHVIQYGLEDMRMLATLLNQSWNFPCRHFHVDNSFRAQNDFVEVQGKQEVVTAFFKSVAPFVKKLTLSDCELPEDQRDIEPLFPESPSPNIRSLEYALLETLSVRLEDQRHLHFVRGIVRNAPRLMDIQFGNSKMFTAIMESMSVCRKLQKLSFQNGILRNMDVNRMLQLGVCRLTELYMLIHVLPNPVLSPESLIRLLEMQRHTLIKLTVLFWGYMKRPFFLDLPPLTRLKSLKIQNFTNPVTEDGERDPEEPEHLRLSMDRGFLALRKIEITPDLDLFWKSNVVAPMEAVKEVGLLSLHDGEAVSTVARVFPNLVKMRSYVSLERVTIEQFGVLEKVEELFLAVSDRSLDHWLTGNGGEEIDQLRSLPAHILTTLSRATEPAPFLKHLKKLKIDGYRVQLSDLACRLVLLKLPHLTRLDLQGCILDPPGISESVLTEMRIKFSVLLNEE